MHYGTVACWSFYASLAWGKKSTCCSIFLMHGILPPKCSRLGANPSPWMSWTSIIWPAYRGGVPLSHYQVQPMGMNLWEITFVGIAERDLSRARMARSLSEMSLTGPWGPFCSLFLDWLVVQHFTWPTGLIYSTPWNALNQRCSTSVMQYSLWWKNK